MNADYTHILYILDRSGSMASVMKDVKQGFDAYIDEQKKMPGKCTFSLVKFDDKYEVVYSFTDISNVKPLEFAPRGSTALLDAIGRAMNETGAVLSAMNENDRPGKILVVIHTDGEENSSHEYTKAQIGEMIKHQETVYNWKVAFIGTQFDVIGEAGHLNIGHGNVLAYNNTSRGIHAAYAAVSKATSSVRSATMDCYMVTNNLFNPEDTQNVADTK